ncbi:MAG: GntR family transcriptional regulator [Firmicutes bacterium]|nr:GntR family transcriptional regulator [Bacillota bacterium]
MDIIISNSSGTPIYEQITTQIKAQVMEGRLKPGEPIPSMRALAKALHISVITVQKAYEDLQRDGFIQTTVGKGSFISAAGADLWQEEQQRITEEYLTKAAESGKRCGLKLETLQQLLKMFYEEE